MSNPLLPQTLGTIGNANTVSNAFVDEFQPRDPTPFDIGFPVQKKWLNTVLNRFWELKNFDSSSGQPLANWVLLGSSSLIEKLEGNTGGPVGPDASQIIHTVGDGTTITVAGNPLTNTLTWSLVGSGSLEKIQVDTFTPPGTNPVVPDGTGKITVTGGQIPADSTPNVIRTDSLAANTYTIEVQRSTNNFGSDRDMNGVCHFDRLAYPVDANGFVQFPTFVTQAGSAYPFGQVVNFVGFNGITTSAVGDTVNIIGSTTPKASFLATLSVTQPNVTGDGTEFTVIFDTVQYDITSSYNNATGLFTAPVTGQYHFDAGIFFEPVTTNHTSYEIRFAGTVLTLRHKYGYNFGGGPTSGDGIVISGNLSLTAGQTVEVECSVGNSTKTVGVLGSAVTPFDSFFTGFQIQ